MNNVRRTSYNSTQTSSRTAIVIVAAIAAVVLLVVCICNSVRASNAADEFLLNLEAGAFDEIASVTNNNYNDILLPESQTTSGSDTDVSDSDVSIISVIMQNSDYSRSSIVTIGRSAKFKLTVSAPNMYDAVTSLAQLENADTITEEEITNIFMATATDPSTELISTTIPIKVVITDGQPVFYMDEADFVDAVSGNLTVGYRELYNQAVQEMIDYLGGKNQ